MKILLVQAYLGRKETFYIYPLGLDYLATVLHEHGYKVKIFDPNVISDPYTGLTGCIDRFSPDLIGLSLRNIDNQLRIDPFYYYKYFQKTLQIVTGTGTQAKIIVGGPGFSMYSRTIMEQNPSIDYGVYLEGEESFVELIANMGSPGNVKGVYYREGGQVKYSGDRALPDFSRLPIPKRIFCDLAPYLEHVESLGIQSKRGCPKKCAYCNYPHLNGKTLRLRSAESVCDEIEYLMSKFNVKSIKFVDAVFNIPKSHAQKICNEIIDRGIKVKWSAYMDVKDTDKELVLLMKQAGCVDICFSPDAVSQNGLDGLQKGLTEKELTENFNMFAHDRDLKDINVVYSVFLNPPGETFPGLLKTLGFYLKGKLMLRGRGTAFVNWIRMEPNIKVLELAIQQGVVPQDVDLLPERTKDIKRTFFSNPPQSQLDFLLIFLLKAQDILIEGLKKILGARKK